MEIIEIKIEKNEQSRETQWNQKLILWKEKKEDKYLAQLMKQKLENTDYPSQEWKMRLQYRYCI